jgi:hypothetical protein
MRFLAAPLYGASSAVVLAIFLAMTRDGLNASIARASLGVGALVAGLALWQGRHTAIRRRSLSFWEWACIVLFALFSLRAFLWLIFRDDDAIKVLSPNNLGDMSLHLTYINYLANGAAFWPDNPIHSHSKLTYPVGADLFNSLLTLLDVDVVRGLIWVGLAGCLLTGAALWRWGGAFALAGFLCNGGLLGFDFLRRWELLDYQTDSSWPEGFPEIGWKSIPLALFVTQRGFLFALPAGLLLLTSWRQRFFRGDPGGSHLPFCGEVLLYASMPVFHLHTFLFLSFVLGVWFLVHKGARVQLALLAGAALVPASALVFLVTGMFKSASVVGLHPGWMQDGQNFFLFWFSNFGVLPVLVGALCFVLVRQWRGLWPAALVFPAIGIFLLCCVVKFAPWEWDNTKLMIWSYLAILPALWTHLISRWPQALRACTCVLLFFSGCISLLGGLNAPDHGYSIATRSELDGVASAIRRIPVAERFAGYPTYNHPLLLLGRPMALGYSGHVWSHGLDFVQPRIRVDALLYGKPEWRRCAQELAVRFVFWGREEREHYLNSTQPWRSEATLVAAGEWGEIYDLLTPAVPSAAPGAITPARERDGTVALGCAVNLALNPAATMCTPTASVRRHDTWETFCAPAIRWRSRTATSAIDAPSNAARICASMVQP